MSNIWVIYLKLVIYKSRFSGHWFSYTISFTAIPRVYQSDCVNVSVITIILVI